MITRKVRLRRTIFGMTLAMVAGLVPVSAASASNSANAPSAPAEAPASEGLSIYGTDGVNAAATPDGSTPSTEATEPDADSTTASTDASTTSTTETVPAPTTSAPDTTVAEPTTTASPSTSAPATSAAPSEPSTPASTPDSVAPETDPMEGIFGPDFEVSTDQPNFDPVALANRYIGGAESAGQPGFVADGASFANPEWSNAVLGGYVVRYDQQVQGIPVWGAGAVVRLDEKGELLSVAQDKPTAVPAQGLAPTVPAANASTAAVDATRARMSADEKPVPADAALTAQDPILTVYDASRVGGDPNADRFDGPVLVWDVTVANEDLNISYRNLVDATTGEALLTFSEIEGALNRISCDMDNNVERLAQGACKSVRTEGQGPSPSTDVNIGYDLAGYYYNSIKNRFGRDSYDGKGAQMLTAVNVCQTSDPRECPMSNAFWNSKAILIGDGLEFDDVIFHEWTHAVTEYSADLLYYAESGAINESMSDVFGEILDQAYTGPGSYDTPGTKWLIGEGMDVRYLPQPLRSMKNPPSIIDRDGNPQPSPDRVLSPHYWTRDVDNWGVHINSGVNNKAAYLIANGGTFRGQRVRRIGNNKTLALYYEVLTGLLTPGSDYLDLAEALPQACKNLVKQNKLTNGDCVSVRNAVKATQMNQAWKQRYIAPNCTSGKVQTQFYGDAESGLAAQFTTKASRGAKSFVTSTIGSQSGKRSYYNPAVPSTQSYPESILQTRYPVYISKQQPAYLRFDHSHYFWSTGSAAVIEYSTNGRTWEDLGTAKGTINGYPGQVTGGPLDGRKAFGALSKGFEQVRVPLSFLAGKSVMFRWRYVGGTRPTVDPAGSWMIDDIRVFTCGASAPTDTKTYSGRFQPVSPKRLFDTRPNQPPTLVNVPARRLNAGQELQLDLTALPVFRYGDQPTAVALNVTAVGSNELNHVTVYPCGSNSGTSTLNFGPGEATANAAIVPITSNQRLCVKPLKSVNLLADITGYFTTTRFNGTSTYRPISPRRVFDTRNNNGNLFKVPTRKVKSGSTIKIPMSKFGIYTKGDKPVAAAVTVTAARSDTIGHVTAYPCADGRPVASSLNLKPGRAVPNSAIVPFDKNGEICLYTVGTTDLLMDVTGYFTFGARGLQFASVSPVRAVDTRGEKAKFDIKGLRKAGQSTKVPMSTLGVYGKNTPKAAVINMTSAGAKAPGHANVYPCSSKAPNTSINNYLPGSARASGAIATLGDGDMCMFNFKPVHLLVDVTGYFY